jgi:tetratricopeptide (TPR) repeat protein
LRPDLVKALEELATLLKSKGRGEEARPYLDRVHHLTDQKSNLRLADSSNSQGLELMKAGKLDEALKAFTDALMKDSSNAAAAYNQGLVLARQNRLPEAAQAFRLSIRLHPGFALAHLGLGLVLKASNDPSAEEELAKARLLNKLVPPATTGREAPAPRGP